jgi:hypothetical protein
MSCIRQLSFGQDVGEEESFPHLLEARLSAALCSWKSLFSGNMGFHTA